MKNPVAFDGFLLSVEYTTASFGRQVVKFGLQQDYVVEIVRIHCDHPVEEMQRSFQVTGAQVLDEGFLDCL